MEKVDPMYIFNSKHSLIDLSSDTRLKFSSQEAADWLSDACMFYCVHFFYILTNFNFMYSKII